MNSEKPFQNKKRSGFSLVEVTLALGIVGMAILSLVGILGATFRQADEIMQTNRALAAATRLIGALDNPRSIVSFQSIVGDSFAPPTKSTPSQSILDYAKIGLNQSPKIYFNNFDLSFNMLRKATGRSSAVWFYVYDRKVTGAKDELDESSGSKVYNVYSNPTVTEVALVDDSSQLTPAVANNLNIVGNPMRVRVTLSRLLVGQRFQIDRTTFEPSTTTMSLTGIDLSNTLGADADIPNSKYYALAYLPVVAEFFPHDWSAASTFKNSEETPVLVQTIIISR